jgi:ribosomal protein L18E
MAAEANSNSVTQGQLEAWRELWKKLLLPKSDEPEVSLEKLNQLAEPTSK